MTNTSTARRPSHTIYAVIKRGTTGKGSCTRIGAAWPNSDGKGFSCKFDLMPLNGTDIVLREARDAREGDAQ